MKYNKHLLHINNLDNPFIPPHKQTTLKDINVVKVYNCYYGKKIWDQSQPQQYSDGCIYSSFEGAAKYAETQRARGRTIYIKELPALLLDNGEHLILITELNKATPLSLYSVDATKEKTPPGTIKIPDHGDNYIALGAPMNGVLLSFNKNSRFWKKEHKKNSDIIILHLDKKIPTEPLKTTKPKAWSSKSAGKNLPLEWYEEESEISQSAILRHYKKTILPCNKKKKFKAVSPLGKKTKSKQENIYFEDIYNKIRNQESNNLFFFYRENDVAQLFGGCSQVWIEPNNGKFNINSDYLLYTESPKKGVEVFEVDQNSCEIVAILKQQNLDQAA